MTSDQAILLIVGLVVVAVVAFAVVMMIRSAARKRRVERLQQRFGPEYDAAVARYGKNTEQELERRVKRVERLQLRALSPGERDAYVEAWRSIQSRFVEDPSLAIAEANHLVKDVMQARGYPMADFEQRAADVSVDHPSLVQDYRAARAIAERSRAGQATTEEQREALIRYKALFHDLLEVETPELHEVHR
jgi:hypothetical protein